MLSVEKPVVLDADGINALSEEPDLLARRKWPTVITPHPGELGRLIGEAPNIINTDRIEYASRCAVEWGVHLLLKGAPTIAAHPDGYSLMNSSGNAGMASGGTGDVLTGLITALIGQQVEPFSAAAAGAYFHGLAADIAAADVGEPGLTASDILDYLPLVMTEPEHEEDDHDV
jgi:NAD(P)H-hydrate epimerase